MPDIGSAGIAQVALSYGKTCRKNVLSGVHVPVVPGAAGRAPEPHLTIGASIAVNSAVNNADLVVKDVTVGGVPVTM